jgi:LexA-binding, inner membrane-associated putative hydrolase
MANYATHIAVGTVVSGALATLTVGADVIGPESIMAVTLAGVAGSVLPDIDLRDGRASTILFSGIAVFASFCVLFINAERFSIAELWILWLGSLVFVRYGLHALFYRIAVHRGVWHSLLAGLLWAGLTAIVFHDLLGRHAGVAWLGGGFMFIGYLTHLILDEIYSVDFLGNRLKASFGSALKIVDTRYPGHSLTMAMLTVLVLFLAPPTRPLVDAVSSPALWSGLNERLLPDGKWFGVIGGGGEVATAKRQGGNPITTGSIPARPEPSTGGETALPVEE